MENNYFLMWNYYDYCFASIMKIKLNSISSFTFNIVNEVRLANQSKCLIRCLNFT